MTDRPEDPFTALAQGAAAVHELFLSFIAAGFTEYQALYLTARLLIASQGNQGPEDQGEKEVP